MDLGLQGKRALVFGASSGLGKAIAKVFVAEGVRVAVSARAGERLERAARELPAAVAIAGDLRAPGAAAQAVSAAQAALGGIDIVVTNCGGPPLGTFLSLDTATWEATYRSLWMSAVEAMRVALPPMIEQRWGRVLLVTSSTAREPMAGLTLSNAFRPGLHGLANSVSKEVAAEGVTVNAIMPGTIDTERLAELGLDRRAMAHSAPARRLGRPEEIGWLAAFLASERAGYINGQAIACDGARLASI